MGLKPMEQIVITHGFVKKLTANIRSKYGREARHTEVLELVADALGFKAGPLMHALKQQAAPAAQWMGEVIPPGISQPPGLPVGLVLRKAETEFESIVLPSERKETLRLIIEEQRRSREVQAEGLVPLNKLLLIGKFKDSVAEAIANSLGLPLLELSYGALRSERPEEAARRIHEVFDYAARQRCVLLLDDLDVVGLERADMGSTEDVKRIVSSLLVQLDDVPSNVIVIGGTIHPQLLDRAFLRRFHMRVDLSPPKPSVPRVILLRECEALTEHQRRHIALVEKEDSGEQVLLVVKEYDNHPEAAAARQYLRRRGHDWSRTEFCSAQDMAAIYNTAARSRGREE
jgi:SpoVK/Ycf46/Vps4 family AAA+-type ATPase